MLATFRENFRPYLDFRSYVGHIDELSQQKQLRNQSTAGNCITNLSECDNCCYRAHHSNSSNNIDGGGRHRVCPRCSRKEEMRTHETAPRLPSLDPDGKSRARTRSLSGSNFAARANTSLTSATNLARGHCQASTRATQISEIEASGHDVELRMVDAFDEHKQFSYSRPTLQRGERRLGVLGY